MKTIFEYLVKSDGVSTNLAPTRSLWNLISLSYTKTGTHLDRAAFTIKIVLALSPNTDIDVSYANLARFDDVIDPDDDVGFGARKYEFDDDKDGVTWHCMCLFGFEMTSVSFSE